MGPRETMVLEWSFTAPPAAVWRGWTDPEMMRKWFGSDPKGVVLHAAVDLRIGGWYEVSFVNSDDTEYTCAGTYREVVPLSLLVFTWTWKDKPAAAELVTIRLEPAEAGTLMTFRHADIDPGTTHDYEAGWKRTFQKLARALG